MSESKKWEAIGEAFGRAIASGINSVPMVAATIRAHYAKAYGKCRRCDAPLGGPSPEQVCETCHADETLEGLRAGIEAGEA